jgi:hypothetical protein
MRIHYCPIKLILVMLCVWFGYRASYAYEPPRECLKEALGKGNLSFIGKVIREQEIRSDVDEASVEMIVEVRECLYGLACQKGKRLRIEYLSQAFVEGVFPVHFRISTEYVFVFRNQNASKDLLHFDSALKDGTDWAFQGETLPRSPLEDDGELVPFRNVYTGKPCENVKIKELVSWSRRGK